MFGAGLASARYPVFPLAVEQRTDAEHRVASDPNQGADRLLNRAFRLYKDEAGNHPVQQHQRDAQAAEAVNPRGLRDLHRTSLLSLDSSRLLRIHWGNQPRIDIVRRNFDVDAAPAARGPLHQPDKAYQQRQRTDEYEGPDGGRRQLSGERQLIIDPFFHTSFLGPASRLEGSGFSTIGGVCVMRKSVQSASIINFPALARPFARRPIASSAPGMTCLVLVVHQSTDKAFKVSDCADASKAVWVPKVMLSIDEVSERGILVASMSKAFAQQKGLREGWAIDPTLLDDRGREILAEAKARAAQKRIAYRGALQPTPRCMNRNVFA